MGKDKIEINRAAVLTLWAAVVAERRGYDEQEALTLGRGLAGLNAQSKGRRLGIYRGKEGRSQRARQHKPPESVKLQLVTILGRGIPAVRTAQGLRASVGGEPIDPQSVQTYLERKFGEHLGQVRTAMEKLARAYTPAQLEAEAYALYEKFRPKIPEGKKGWGAKGELDLELVRSLAK